MKNKLNVEALLEKLHEQAVTRVNEEIENMREAKIQEYLTRATKVLVKNNIISEGEVRSVASKYKINLNEVIEEEVVTEGCGSMSSGGCGSMSSSSSSSKTSSKPKSSIKKPIAKKKPSTSYSNYGCGSMGSGNRC